MLKFSPEGSMLSRARVYNENFQDQQRVLLKCDKCSLRSDFWCTLIVQGRRRKGKGKTLGTFLQSWTLT